MKHASKSKTPTDRTSLWIALNLLGIAVVAGIFLWSIPTGGMPSPRTMTRAVLIVGAMCVCLYHLIRRKRQLRSFARTSYADRVGTAFDHDNPRKKRLLSALTDHAQGNYDLCRRKLHQLGREPLSDEQQLVVRYFTALCLSNSGDPGSAAGVYRQILKDHPDHAPSLSNLSAFYAQRGAFDQAISYGSRALALDKTNPSTYQNLSYSYFYTYDLPRAKECARQALALKPDMYPSVTMLAAISAAEGDALAAKGYVQQAVKLGQPQDKLDRAVQSAKKLYADHARIMERVEGWTRRTGRPVIRMEITDQPSKSVLGGRLGEVPPTAPDGSPMGLLAAIFCSELPKNDLFPPRGVLRFYIARNDTYGADFDHLDRQTGFRVLFDPEELHYTAVPDYTASDDPFPVSEFCYLHFTAGTDPMPHVDFRYGDTVAQALAADPTATEEDYYCEDFTQEIPGGGHKLGGYATFTQWDPREPGSQYAAYDTLLLQLDSDVPFGQDRVMFGDNGVCGFFISAEDLRAGDFSHILYTWDCY